MGYTLHGVLIFVVVYYTKEMSYTWTIKSIYYNTFQKQLFKNSFV
jgi:hypothetical protein